MIVTGYRILGIFHRAIPVEEDKSNTEASFLLWQGEKEHAAGRGEIHTFFAIE